MAMGECAVQFLYFIPFWRNVLHCATVNCSEKRVCAPVAHKMNYQNCSKFDNLFNFTRVNYVKDDNIVGYIKLIQNF